MCAHKYTHTHQAACLLVSSVFLFTFVPFALWLSRHLPALQAGFSFFRAAGPLIPAHGFTLLLPVPGPHSWTHCVLRFPSPELFFALRLRSPLFHPSALDKAHVPGNRTPKVPILCHSLLAASFLGTQLSGVLLTLPRLQLEQSSSQWLRHLFSFVFVC